MEQLNVQQMPEFSAGLLSEFIHEFYGYGNYGGRYCFVGMEEGGGNTLVEIERRVRSWAQRGKRPLEDLKDYHSSIGGRRFFEQPTRSQPTWNKLIRVVLAAQRQSPTLEMFKAYQHEAFAGLGGDTCLLELLPLPSPSVGKWIYADFASVEGLQSRDSYRQRYAPLRARYLKQRIIEHRPQAVIFYSIDSWYRQWWEMIAGVNFEAFRFDEGVYYMADSQGTRFFALKHPASRGVTNDYYHQIGRLITS